MNHHLEPLLVLARLLLGNRNPDLGRSADGDRETFALVWDMNRLFEEYMGRGAHPGVAAVSGVPGGTAGRVPRPTWPRKPVVAARNAFLLRPDILVYQGQKPWLVADTKWKRLDPRQTNLGVSETDLYQVLAYAHRFETDRAILLYPHHPALGLAGLQRALLIQGTGPQQTRVRIITLDLARIEEVPEQLVRATFSSETVGN